MNQSTNQAFDPKLFRRVMGQFATGITVVTALDCAGQHCGITANSFTSVSLDPPLALVCVDKRIDFYQVIESASHFNVNFLAADQQHLSQRFSTRGIDKFADIEHAPGVHGASLLAGTLGHIECEKYEVLPGGDHIIVLGKVERLDWRAGEPLLYFSSRYRWLQTQEEKET